MENSQIIFIICIIFLWNTGIYMCNFVNGEIQYEIHHCFDLQISHIIIYIYYIAERVKLSHPDHDSWVRISTLSICQEGDS